MKLVMILVNAVFIKNTVGKISIGGKKHQSRVCTGVKEKIFMCDNNNCVLRESS